MINMSLDRYQHPSSTQARHPRAVSVEALIMQV